MFRRLVGRSVWSLDGYVRMVNLLMFSRSVGRSVGRSVSQYSYLVDMIAWFLSMFSRSVGLSVSIFT